MRNKINIVYGPTASGKTKYGVKLAQELDGIVINADSMQIYKELPIITAQPSIEEMADIEHRMYGYFSCFNHYNVAKWIEDVVPQINNVLSLGKTPILVGGTGMYIKALIDGLNANDVPQDIRKLVAELPAEEVHARLEISNKAKHESLSMNDLVRRRRALELALADKTQIKPAEPIYDRNQFYLISLNPNRETVYNNINNRFLEMLKNGALEEAKFVNSIGIASKLPKAHGLPELIAYLNGEITLDEATSKAQQNVRNYAKRQFTWARHQFKFDEIINL